jgi:hypothetical protein
MPIANPETSVFISYSSADRPFASRLADDLMRRGVKVWIDQAAIGPGARWLEKIEEAVAQSDFLIAVLSRSSVGSRWVRREIRLALAQGMQEKRAKLIPVAYERCSLPRALSQIQVVDLSTSAAYRRGLERLLGCFAASWTISRHMRKPWTKRGSRLAIRGGILEEVEGRLDFSPRVAERLRSYYSRWIRGLPVYGSSRVLKKWNELSGLAVLHSFRRGVLTAEQEIKAATEAHDHLLEFLLDLATRGGILDETGGVLSLNGELGEEMSGQIERVVELGFTDEVDDLRAAATLLFIELIRERLLDRIPNKASFAEALGTVIHDMLGFWTGPGNARPTRTKPAVKNRRRRKIRG